MSSFSEDEGLAEGIISGISAGSVATAGTAGSTNEIDSDSHTRVITIRGTEDGLVVRIDGRAEWEEIRRDLEEFLGDKKRFFEGSGVAVEWLDRLPTKEQSADLEKLLTEKYGIEIITKRRRAQQLRQRLGATSETGERSGAKGAGKSGITISLFDVADEILTPSALTSGSDSFDAEASPVSSSQLKGSNDRSLNQSLEVSSTRSSGGSFPGDRKGAADSLSSETRADALSQKYIHRMARVLGEEVFYDEDANAKVVFGTLRSGQRVETPFSLIVVGDVNPGADLIAGGDIIVLGSLRGTAHAAAYDEEAVDRVIIALHMQPMQLRIGSVISRGSDERVRGTEIAHIEERRIVVEAFHTKLLSSKRKIC